MAKKVRMLSTLAHPEYVLVAGRVYIISDALYAQLAPINSPSNPIFDAEPDIELGEKTFKQEKPDPGETASGGAEPRKKPTFTAEDPPGATTVAPEPAKKKVA